MTTGKPKIQKTNRILLQHGSVIYCSCEIIRDVRDHVVRLNQRLAPKKGELPVLLEKLFNLALTKPDHFPESSRRILLNGSF